MSNQKAYEQYRFNASGVITDIELLLTVEQWKHLDELANGKRSLSRNLSSNLNDESNVLVTQSEPKKIKFVIGYSGETIIGREGK